MKKALVLINAYSRLQHSLNQSQRLKEELETLGVSTDILRNNFFAAIIQDDGCIVSKLRQYDFCIYLDKDKYVSNLLEKTNLPLFNCHDSIVACDDKMTTAILLSNHGIAMPKTLPGLLCYNPEESIPEKTIEQIASSLGFPLIVKHSYGSLGKGVFKVDNMEQLKLIVEEVKCTPHLFQRFIKSSYGRDIRVIIIGGKYVAAMERRSARDFRSNLELGGTGIAITPPEKVISDCEQIASLLHLDYCGIDILYGEDVYYVCEVNSNAFFGGIEQATHLNIAKLYANYILNKIYKGL